MPAISTTSPAFIGERDWLDSEGFFIFGKHNGKDVNRVAESDPSYLQWVLDEVDNIANEDREVIETALAYSR